MIGKVTYEGIGQLYCITVSSGINVLEVNHTFGIIYRSDRLKFPLKTFTNLWLEGQQSAKDVIAAKCRIS